MKSIFLLGSLVVMAALLLGAGYVVWLVFGGGPEKWSAGRALAGRTYAADTPLSIGQYLDVKAPRGFKAEQPKASLDEHRGPETVWFELSLGKYVALGGGGTPAQMYLAVASPGNEGTVLPGQSSTWKGHGVRDGLQLFDGNRADSPGEVVVAAVDTRGGRRAELHTTDNIYSMDQAFAIVCQVVQSMSVHRQAIDALFAKARSNVAMDTNNQAKAFALIASKLEPFPSEPGVAGHLADGGYLMRDYKEDTSAHTAIVLASQAVTGDAEKAAVALTLDPSRIKLELSNEVASTNDSFPLPDGGLRVGVLALWLDADGGLRVIDLQTGTAPHWSREDYHEPWRAALKACAQPGKLTFVRFANFWDFNNRKLSDIGGWIDASRQMAAWAKEGHPLWIARKST
jgi:hypothetical protein